MKKEHLNVLGDFIGIFQNLVTADFNITLTNLRDVIAIKPGKTIKFDVNVGDALKEGTVALEAMQLKKPISRLVPRELYGIPYMGRAIPLFDDNEVIGCVVVAESLDTQERLINMAQSLSATIQQISASMEENTAGLESVANIGNKMEKATEISLQSVKETDKIVDTVYNIARQSKLLGINASIEAARAGNVGRAFNVVATEISQLAENTTSFTKKIADILEKLKTENDEVNKTSQELSAVLNQITAATEEVSAATQSIANMSSELLELAENLI